MADTPSKLWRLALVVSLLLLAAASYAKIEPFREAVDSKCPWIKEELADHGIKLDPGASVPADTGTTHPEGAAAPSPSSQGTGAPPTASASPVSQGSLPPTAGTTSVEPLPAGNVSKADPVTLNQLIANRSLWPKTVRLKQATVFKAVVDRKEVGEITVPAGKEVKLVQILPDKIGVAFSPDGKTDNLGGAYLKPEATDLLERAHAGIK